MVDPTTYAMHGYRITSSIELPGAPLGDGPAEIVVDAEACRPVALDAPRGRVLGQSTSTDAHRGWSLAEQAGGYLFRISGMCEFVISPDLRSVQCVRDPSIDPAMMGILIVGNLINVILTLDGKLGLHASAVVERQTDTAVAFVGDRGWGKSTSAALLCARGARMLTDDLLRVDLIDGRAVAYRGTLEPRLRDSAPSILTANVDVGIGRTVDGRTALQVEACQADRVELLRIAVPLLSDSARVTSRRASASEALLSLSGLARLVLTDAVLQTQQFHLTASLVEAIDVTIVNIPVSGVSSSALADELYDCVFASA
ncbi:MAG: hypothetical protein ABI658_30965 [Acidimicrobiales bacterium]